MRLKIGTTDVFYTITGSGPTVVVIHGWLHDHTSFAALTKELQDDFRIIAVDLPNFGATSKNRKITDMRSYATWLAAVLRKMEVTDFTLVGHSMGGQIAAYATAKEIVKPKKLILIAASGVRSLRPLRRKITQEIAVPLGKLIPRKLKPQFYKFMETDYAPELAPEHKRIRRRLLKQDIERVIRQITVPTLLIFGGDDIFTTTEMGKFMHDRIPRSRLAIVQGHRHRLQQTAAGEVATLIRRFI